MYRLTGISRETHWGSKSKLKSVFTLDDEKLDNVGEVWFGTHKTTKGSNVVINPKKQVRLIDLITGSANKNLGKILTKEYGEDLPYLFKVIAVAQSLSIQIHPNAETAQEGFDKEEKSGVWISDKSRIFKDPTAKPELFIALENSYVFVGVAEIKKIESYLADIKNPIVTKILGFLKKNPDENGIKEAIKYITSLKKDALANLDKFITALNNRLETKKSPHDIPHDILLKDKLIVTANQDHPKDPTLFILTLLNALQLEAYDGVYVAPGTIHCYVRGYGVEMMLNSDNVIRIGLTKKPKNVSVFLKNANLTPTKDVLADRVVESENHYEYFSNDDQKIAVEVGLLGEPNAKGKAKTLEIFPKGPRILLSLDGTFNLNSAVTGKNTINPKEAFFIPDADGSLKVTGKGTFLNAFINF